MEEVLVQDVAGCRWLFSCNGQKQLCYQIESGGREILLPDMSEEFDIVTGADGCIHLAAQDLKGTLLYLCYDGDAWRKYPILHSKSGQQSLTQLRLFSGNSRVHAFYILQHNGRHMLVHHAFGTDGAAAAPQPIDYVHPTRRYCVAADSKQTCHLFFFDEDSVLQSRQFQLSNDACRIADPPITGQIRAVSAICDASGNLHTACLAQQKQYYTISYSRAGNSSKLLSFGVDHIAALAVVVTDKRVAVQWQERYNVYECTSGDGGETFSKPRNLSATKGSGTKLIRARRPANPWGLMVDRCACIGFSPLGCDALFSKSDSKPSNPKQHTSQTQWQTSDALNDLQVRLTQTQANVARLQQLVDRLLANQNAPERTLPPKPPQPENIPQPKTEIDLDSVGEIDQDNYQLFQQMTVDDMDFSAGQTF